MTATTPPLQGLRVLDLSRVLSGPFATMRLADLGADVVKVEAPGGDESRRFGPPFVEGRDGHESAYFLAVNRGKRSICMDLGQAPERALLSRLVGVADVLVSNFRPGVLGRLGLSPAELVAARPDLVICRISGFGPDDPRPGYDNVVQFMSGIPSLTGAVDGPPAKCGASIADLVAGMNAAQIITAALLRRERTGRGGIVDVPMLDGLLDLLVYHAVGWLDAGVAPQRRGNAHESVHPLRTYATADGRLVLAVGNDLLFGRLMETIGLPKLATDPRFASNPSRVAHRAELDAELERALATETTATWVDRFAAAGVPGGAVQSVPQALSAARLVSHAHPHGGPMVRTVAPPWWIDGTTLATTRRAPRLGEHRAEVLRDWLGDGS
ncbi:MAG: CoA transferase [Oligoflexia bacterium]|nr:CoA transferase [Oligoflexia bacterium]